jgi:hypothetical protein
MAGAFRGETPVWQRSLNISSLPVQRNFRPTGLHFASVRITVQISDRLDECAAILSRKTNAPLNESEQPDFPGFRVKKAP